jgi:phospholipid transport system substrate-binding protein
MKKILLGVITSLALQAFAAEPLEDFIQDISSQTIQIIEKKTNDKIKNDKLEEIFHQVMDLDWMAKFAIAKFWKNLSEQDKIAYLAAYRSYLVKAYVPKFKEYNNQKVKIISIKDLGNEQFQVATQIISKDGQTINIGYRCKKEGENFKIRDITGEDFSLLTTQRADFSTIINNGGIEKLIKILLEKS